MASKLLIGFAAGVLVGVLFAPEAGAATRQRIADKGTDLKDKFSDFIDNLTHRADEVATKAGNRAEEFVNKASHRAEEFANKTDNFGTGTKPKFQS